MRKIILATGNKNKLKEIKKMYPDDEILSLADVGFFEDIEETGTTFLENATIKVDAISNFLKDKDLQCDSIIAEDSGLCVDALGGEPGIYSARYAGEHGNDEANRQKLLAKLKGETNRKAYFITVAVEQFANGDRIWAEGKTYGQILPEARGEGGFAFDRLFLSDDLGKSFAEVSVEEKNKVSHRYRAMRNLQAEENKYINK